MNIYEGWLARAKQNLERAKLLIVPNMVYYEDNCFDAQQAVEKALKGLLIYYGEEKPEWTHNIEKLLIALNNYTTVPDTVQLSTGLTTYATKTRYDITPEVTKEDYEESVKIAEECLAWVEQQIREGTA
jgi:HEPN domain-containing protein